MKKLLVVALLILSSNVRADIVRWELRNVIFDDGATTTGFFDFDRDAGVYYPLLQLHSGILYDFDFKVSGGARPAFEYDPDTAHFRTDAAYGLQFNTDEGRFFYIGLSHSQVAPGQVLPNGPIGATYPIDTVDHEYDFLSAREYLGPSSTDQRFVGPGAYLLATDLSPSVPEPVIWAMMLPGLGLLLASLRQGPRYRVLSRSP
jgi:hypothetical protein